MDWLSGLLELIPVRGQLDFRCLLGAPWRMAAEPAQAGEVLFHAVMEGAVTVDVGARARRLLEAGDILILPHGDAHILHDGGGETAHPIKSRQGVNVVFNENDGTGARLDMLCGRFVLSAQHSRMLRSYLPPVLIVRTGAPGTTQSPSGAQLIHVLALMRAETDAGSLGGQAMLNALSTALFTLTLRHASEAPDAPTGLLALAANPRLAPALTAMLRDPATPWTLPNLAKLCNMSRATFVRHFDDSLGKSASEFLTDIRMTLAANALRTDEATVGAVAEAVGYQSEAAFQRAFKTHMGVTPAQWRRGEAAAPSPGE